MATSLNLNTLPEYVEQNKDQLFVKATLGAKTLDYIEVMTGVKHKEALNYLDSEVVVKGAACGWNPDGSDTISQKYIEVALAEVEKEYCYIDFKNYFMNYQLNWEAGRETLPFEEKFAESNANRIKDAVEDGIWQGISGVDKGFIARFADESATTIDAQSGETISSRVDALVAGASARMLKKGVNIFMSATDFRNYVLAANSTCCANRPLIDAASESIVYAGDSRIKLIPVLGLEDTGYIVAATPDALVYGTDVEDADSTIDIFFDKKEQKFNLRALWAMGTALKYLDEIVVSKAAE